MLYSSFIQISKFAYQNNLNFLKSFIGPHVRFSSVIKGNAYGHGIEQFAPMAQSCGVDHFSVFSADEAFRLQQALPQPATILIMGYLDTPELEWAITHDIEFYVFENARLEAAIAASKRLGKPALVHVELETGMNRTGYTEQELLKAVSLLRQSQVQVRGICTHYAGAESEENHERVDGQIKRFHKVAALLKQRGKQAAQLHTACSAAVMAFPQTHMDLVRVGIMQYGFWPSRETHALYTQTHGAPDPLLRLITWKSKIMSIKTVAAGEYVGYGKTYRAERDVVLATVPVGYAWGYSRSLSNHGQVLLHGQRAAVVGIINMNVLMVDVTFIPKLQVSDEVVLLGTQGDQSITVASFSELSSQLNYELLTRLPLNIPRVVVD